MQTITDQRTYGAPEVACFDYETLGDELDDHHLTWRFYSSTINSDGGEWSGYQAVKHIRYGPDWSKDIITPQTQFFNDVAAGNLANVTWITPVATTPITSTAAATLGPQWVSTLVNAIGESSSGIRARSSCMWDDWGGLYDHVPPPYEDFDGLGFRVPLLVISPYAKARLRFARPVRDGSILRFIEDTSAWGRRPRATGARPLRRRTASISANLRAPTCPFRRR